MKSIYGESMQDFGIIDGCNTHPHHIYMQFSETGSNRFFIISKYFFICHL